MMETLLVALAVLALPLLATMAVGALLVGLVLLVSAFARER